MRQQSLKSWTRLTGQADYTVPPIASVRAPETDDDKPFWGDPTLGSMQGPWVGPAKCLQGHFENRPPIPYGPANAKQDMASLVEEGFKSLRGLLTEGRYVVFESGGKALTNVNGKDVGLSSAARAKHDAIEQRWILHGLADYGQEFYLQSAMDKKYISSDGKMTTVQSGAQAFTIDYFADDKVYTLTPFTKKPGRMAKGSGKRDLSWSTGGTKFSAFSVSYRT